MLKSIHHRHIIRFYDSWVSPETHQIIFISELMSSGTLKASVLVAAFSVIAENTVISPSSALLFPPF